MMVVSVGCECLNWVLALSVGIWCWRWVLVLGMGVGIRHGCGSSA